MRMFKFKIISSFVISFLLITAGAFYFARGDRSSAGNLFLWGMVCFSASLLWLLIRKNQRK
jgi:hypothetical protein